MPYERPGAGYYATATKITRHNDPCIENGVAGAAVKQRANSATLGLAGQQDIAIGERFHIRTKGIKEFPTGTGAKAVALAGAAKGAPVYITTADNTLVLAGGAGAVPFGRVAEIPGEGRGVSDGQIRIDLDLKDSFA